ncbi:hypothetical protein CPSG_07622 [Coccidioides posadasii str. Silveira]|uniref:Uncharacterized protein n=1 Tax=Coccidioides posadasii (strain RMSCC 757 / Silveira) TaxID=443226 RepID=E9DCS0_COCPS|nr:hypothetical protein CPSG_07622 [Coccidioides posadasii str. Silveira]
MKAPVSKPDKTTMHIDCKSVRIDFREQEGARPPGQDDRNSRSSPPLLVSSDLGSSSLANVVSVFEAGCMEYSACSFGQATTAGEPRLTKLAVEPQRTIFKKFSIHSDSIRPCMNGERDLVTIILPGLATSSNARGVLLSSFSRPKGTWGLSSSACPNREICGVALRSSRQPFKFPLVMLEEKAFQA